MLCLQSLRELGTLSFHGMQFFNTAQVSWFFIYSWYSFAFIFGFMTSFFFFFEQGYHCTVKQSWQSLYIFGILKQRPCIWHLELAELFCLINLYIHNSFFDIIIFNCFREHHMFIILSSGLMWLNMKWKLITPYWSWELRLGI